MLSCGEASGDLYAGALVAALRRREPDIDVFGLGGERFKAAGGRLIADFHEILSPLTVPSMIGRPSPCPALCVPVSEPPADSILSVLLCSPIGVLIVRVQVPSTAIANLLNA